MCVNDKALYKSTFTFTLPLSSMQFTERARKSTFWSERHITRDRSAPDSSDPNQVYTKFEEKCSSGFTKWKFIYVYEVKQRLVDVWHGFKQSVIDDAVDEWRKRLLRVFM